MNHLIDLVIGNILPIINSNIVPIAGTLVIIAIGYYLTDLNSRKSTTKGNVKEFTDIFVDFMHTIDFINAIEIKRILFPSAKMKEIIKQHERAAIKLRISLNWWGRIKFNCYWKQYRKKADRYYNAPAQLGFGKPNKEMLETIEKLIKKVKRL